MATSQSFRLLTKCSHAGISNKICSDHVVRVASPSFGAHSNVFQNGRKQSRKFNTTSIRDMSGRLSARHFSTTQKMSRNLISPDNIVSSCHPTIEIPTNEPFHSLMFKKCDEFKDGLAVEEFLTGKSYTFAQVKETAVKVARGLHNMGYRKGDVVLAYTTNCCDFTILMLACSTLGVWFSAANPALTPGELARQIEHSDTQAVFTVPPLIDNVKQALNNPEYSNKVKHLFVFGEGEGFQPFDTLKDKTGQGLPDVDINPVEDVFALPYSSGTTGLPKGVMLTHYNCVANIQQIAPGVGIGPGDAALGLLPLYHIYGMIVVQFSNMYAGSSVHLLPRFEPETFLQCLQDRKISLALIVPPLAVFLAKHPLVSKYDLSSITRIVCGAAPLGAGITKELNAKLPNLKGLNQGFGLTELSPVSHLDTDNNFGSIGYLAANTLGKIVDTETGKVLGVDQIGELAVKGPQVMKGYYKNQEATDDMIRDGWLYTGDIAYFDKDGLFYVKDRLKELIKYKGNQVPPAELEALLLGHPDVQDVAVIGIPDEIAGELPKAFVVKKPGSEVKEEDLIKYIEENVAPVKRLRGGVEFILEVPKNPSGKILRRILKEQYVNKQ